MPVAGFLSFLLGLLRWNHQYYPLPSLGFDETIHNASGPTYSLCQVCSGYPCCVQETYSLRPWESRKLKLMLASWILPSAGMCICWDRELKRFVARRRCMAQASVEYIAQWHSSAAGRRHRCGTGHAPAGGVATTVGLLPAVDPLSGAGTGQQRRPPAVFPI